MKKYTIAIEETVVDQFEIEANDFIEAIDIAKEKYRKGELVVSPGEVQFRQIAVISPSYDCTEWSEF